MKVAEHTTAARISSVTSPSLAKTLCPYCKVVLAPLHEVRVFPSVPVMLVGGASTKTSDLSVDDSTLR